MAYINNQWLQGAPQRNRNHDPIKVEISGEAVTNEWDIKHEIKTTLKIRRSDGDFQYLLFTEADMKLLVNMAKAADSATQQAIALAALSNASDQAIVSFLKILFSKRKTPTPLTLMKGVNS